MSAEATDTAGQAFRLEEINEWMGGRLVGDGTVKIRRPAPLTDAGPDELAMLAEARYVQDARNSGAGALLVAADLEERLQDPRPRIVVADPRVALLPLLKRLDPTPRYGPGVHPTAVLESGVVLGEGVSVGPYAVLEAGAVVGRGSRVGAHCVVGRDVRLGEECLLHPHVVLYANTELGNRVVVQAGARIGADGFGFVVDNGRYRTVPQVGGCIVEDDVDIGANTCVDRGSTGDTVVGRGSKLDNLIHLAHNVHLGEHCGLAALVGIAGSTRVGDWAMMGGQVGVVGHLTLGDRVRVSAQAGVIGDLDDDADVTGFPARERRSFLRNTAALSRVPDALKRLRALEDEVKRLRAALERPDG